MTTRSKQLTKYLNTYRAAWDRPTAVSEILEITDNRTYLSLKDVADQIGRQRSTVLSWQVRGSHEFPQPVGHPSTGQIWDQDDITVWASTHPDLLGEE